MERGRKHVENCPSNGQFASNNEYGDWCSQIFKELVNEPKQQVLHRYRQLA